MQMNGQSVTMEVDTGAALSVISETTRNRIFPKEKLHSTDLILKTYTDEQLEVLGTLNMKVQYGDQTQKLKLVVVAGDGPTLLGRNWLKYIRLNWNSIFAVRVARIRPLHNLLQHHEALFSKELGRVQPYTASLHVQSGAIPNLAQFHLPLKTQ